MYADARAGRTFARDGENGGTPNAVADLLTAIASQRAAGLDSTNELLLDLSDVRTGADRFRAGFPPNIRLAHKTGSGDTERGGVTEATNDAGIVTLPDGRRIVLAWHCSRPHPPTTQRVIAVLAKGRAKPCTRRTRRDAARTTTLARLRESVRSARARLPAVAYRAHSRSDRSGALAAFARSAPRPTARSAFPGSGVLVTFFVTSVGLSRVGKETQVGAPRRRR